MFVKKNFSALNLIKFTGKQTFFITLWVTFVTILHEVTHSELLHIPWLPLSIIGTAVAFYLGFKNNQAYDRLWEARKIWGAIVNDSRSWGATVTAYVSNYFTNNKVSETELATIHRRLIYRHIAWLYTLRNQLLIPTPWEHISQRNHESKSAQRFQEQFGVGLFKDDVTEVLLHKMLPDCDYERIINYQNSATQLINEQSQDLKKLREISLIEDFRHMELQKLLQLFYTHQGKAERIKKFPLPRQYGGMSIIFVGIFIFFLPFTMVAEFHKLGEIGVWLAIPITVLVAWVYLVMEMVGDYSENPFEGLGNDIPMLSLCRVIEIDLREMLGETDLPPNIKAKNNILM